MNGVLMVLDNAYRIAGTAAKVESLKALGYKIVEQPAEEAKKDSEDENKPLDEMKTAELEAFAAKKGIDLSAAKSKPEKLAAIVAALETGEGGA